MPDPPGTQRWTMAYHDPVRCSMDRAWSIRGCKTRISALGRQVDRVPFFLPRYPFSSDAWRAPPPPPALSSRSSPIPRRLLSELRCWHAIERETHTHTHRERERERATSAVRPFACTETVFPRRTAAEKMVRGALQASGHGSISRSAAENSPCDTRLGAARADSCAATRLCWMTRESKRATRKRH